ncbi:MAG: methylated-DNA--[protein]-cysteine S-methyltransferase [Pirellulales bacterium]
MADSTLSSSKARRRQTKEQSGSTLRRVVAFPSVLGWISAVLSGPAANPLLHQLSLGHTSRGKALAALDPRLVREATSVAADRFLAVAFERYASGRPEQLSRFRLAESATTLFARRVLDACRRIPYGQTRSYAQLAAAAGSPGAARAVGTVMAKNKFPLIIPCHRVVGSQGKLGGFSAPGGLEMKQRILDLENRADLPASKPR